MAEKTHIMWRSPAGVVKSFIDANGVWEIADRSTIRSDIPCRVCFSKGSGADPVGAAVAAGIRKPGLTPEAITDATLTLPSLATTTASLPVRVFVDGAFCLTVSGYVAPFVAEVIQ